MDADHLLTVLAPEIGRSVCAWCKAPMGPRPDLDAGQVSHGCCADCYAAVFGSYLFSLAHQGHREVQ